LIIRTAAAKASSLQAGPNRRLRALFGCSLRECGVRPPSSGTKVLNKSQEAFSLAELEFRGLGRNGPVAFDISGTEKDVQMNRQELLDIVALGERAGVEFKNARGREDRNFWEVAKAVLAMANRRDGGLVIVGVVDHRTIDGLTDAQATSWGPEVDQVRTKLDPYADPFVFVDVEIVNATAEGAAAQRCAVITVHQFDRVPVLLAKDVTVDGRVVLNRGACLVRGRQTPATSQVANYADFRELLDIATANGVKEFVTLARQAGLLPPEQAVPVDAAQFEAERADAFDGE
jgi:hypothetical protein